MARQQTTLGRFFSKESDRDLEEVSMGLVKAAQSRMWQCQKHSKNVPQPQHLPRVRLIASSLLPMAVHAMAPMLLSSRRSLPSFRPFRVEDTPQTSQQGQKYGSEEDLSEENPIQLVCEISVDFCLCVYLQNILFDVSWCQEVRPFEYAS